MVKAKLVQLDKLRNTRNGNPVFRAHLQTPEGILAFMTKGDSAFSYEISNYLNKGEFEWVFSGGIIIGVK